MAVVIASSGGGGGDGSGGSDGGGGGGVSNDGGVKAKGESGDWGYTYAGKGSTYTNWQLFGAK